MRIFLPVLLLLVAPPLYAEIYKCTGADNSVVYSDSPCAAGHSQTVTGIQPGQNTAQQSALAQKPAVILQLDAAVKSAIAAGDLTRAEALATTPEHWEWVAEARKANAQNAPPPNQANSEECQTAKQALDQAANSADPAPEVLQAKRSLMYAACDIPEPVELVDEQPTTTVFPYPYAGRRRYPGHIGRHPRGSPGKPSGYTSPPYDRRMAEPFGSRFIRPEDAPR